MTETISAENAAALLTSHLTGLRLTAIKRREADWTFSFANDFVLALECVWRVVVKGRVAHADTDDGQKFGLPSPVDGEERTRRLLDGQTVQNIAIRSTGDLSIEFSGQNFLEAINNSSGYEGWNFRISGQQIIAMGGGQLALYREPTS